MLPYIWAIKAISSNAMSQSEFKVKIMQPLSQPVPRARKIELVGVKRRKIGNQCQAQENKQPVSSAGKQATGSKRGKIGNQCQARENKQPISSAGKQATGAKHGKIGNQCQREKQATGAKRAKTGNQYQREKQATAARVRKHATDIKHLKTCSRYQVQWVSVLLLVVKRQHIFP